MYALRGPWVLDEDAPIATGAPEPFGAAVRGTVEGERLALEADAVDSVVLRYGQLYGPGTYYAADGDFARQARRRAIPIVGRGDGVFFFLHVDDAASTAVCALTRGRGVYNIVDDDPAPARDWIPIFARAVRAPRPLHMPAWLAKLIAGDGTAATLTAGRGASNARAKRELGWKLSHSSWREGFFL
jgi:nucleoside-diphosphate-sugar epimerase